MNTGIGNPRIQRSKSPITLPREVSCKRFVHAWSSTRVPKIESDIIHTGISRIERAINMYSYTMSSYAEGSSLSLEIQLVDRSMHSSMPHRWRSVIALISSYTKWLCVCRALQLIQIFSYDNLRKIFGVTSKLRVSYLLIFLRIIKRERWHWRHARKHFGNCERSLAAWKYNIQRSTDKKDFQRYKDTDMKNGYSVSKVRRLTILQKVYLV